MLPVFMGLALIDRIWNALKDLFNSVGMEIILYKDGNSFEVLEHVLSQIPAANKYWDNKGRQLLNMELAIYDPKKTNPAELKKLSPVNIRFRCLDPDEMTDEDYHPAYFSAWANTKCFTTSSGKSGHVAEEAGIDNFIDTVYSHKATDEDIENFAEAFREILRRVMDECFHCTVVDKKLNHIQDLIAEHFKDIFYKTYDIPYILEHGDLDDEGERFFNRYTEGPW